MTKISKASLLAATAVAALLSTSAGAFAADKVSADMGISYNSHFVSYGADVWGGGNAIYGDNSTTFVYGDLYINPTDNFGMFVNVWTDNNHNTTSAIGGSTQEIDLNIGGSYTVGKFTLGAAYGSWNYAGDTEESIEGSVAFDDSEISPFSLSPKITYHQRIAANGTQGYGAVILGNVSHTFDLDYEGMSLTVPLTVAFFTDNFGGKSGYAYASGGVSLGIPLSFISSDYGAWSMNFDVIGYTTDKGALPGNKAQNFVTSQIGLKVAF